MRKIAEIRRDLAAKVAEVKGIQNSPENADALKKGVAEVKALMLELEQAEAVEAAAQRAADRELDRRQRVAGRPFSLVRYIAGIVAGNMSAWVSQGAGMSSLQPICVRQAARTTRPRLTAATSQRRAKGVTLTSSRTSWLWPDWARPC